MVEKKKIILGISAYYHDSAAALVIDGDIVAAAHEERFSRIKQDARFPKHAITFCLKEAGIAPEDVSYIVFYDKPLLKWERLLETYLSFAPRGVKSFCAAITVWIKEKLFFRRMIERELSFLGFKDSYELLFSEHHLSHAASAFYPSPFKEAAILTVDGVGEWATASIMKGEGSFIKNIKELHFPHSVGFLYSAFTYYLGFRVNSGEYKLMGLAPYGNPNDPETKVFIEKIKKNLIILHKDGSIELNQDYFDYQVGLTMTRDSAWEKLFGLKRKEQGKSDYTQEECNFAYAIQAVTEEIMINMAREAKRLTGADYLCLAGGVALNCVANSKIKEEKLFKEIWIHPAAGDAGGALGAALSFWYMAIKKNRIPDNRDSMKGSYLGPEFSNDEIREVAGVFGAKAENLSDEEILEKTARLLSEGNVVGWFQGRMEWGPRALGNRSILGDARNPDMQKRLNLKIKFREGFRPFAPIVLEEDTQEYFDFDTVSPYMLFTAPVLEKRRNPLPGNYHTLPLKEKLYFLRSDIPAVTHLDYSARLQTVSSSTNKRLHDLLKEFKKQTGHSVLVNTSFNVRGEPIVCSPRDAYLCFMRTDMDYLVLGNMFFSKKDQPVLSKELLDYTYTPD